MVAAGTASRSARGSPSARDSKNNIGSEQNPFHRLRLLPAVVAACFAAPLAFNSALANPVGGSVVAGGAGFNSQGSTLTVTNTPGAIINWQSFSIGSGEKLCQLKIGRAHV